jgi:hypothetical protein
MLHLDTKSGMANITLKDLVQYVVIPNLWMYVHTVHKIFFWAVRFIQIYAFAQHPCQSTISVTVLVTDNYTHHFSFSSPFIPTPTQSNISKIYTGWYKKTFYGKMNNFTDLNEPHISYLSTYIKNLLDSADLLYRKILSISKVKLRHFYIFTICSLKMSVRQCYS